MSGRKSSGGLQCRKFWSPLTRRLGVNVCLLGHDIGSDPDSSFRTPPGSSACQLSSLPLLALSLLPNGPKCLLQSSHDICDERGRKGTKGIFLEWLFPFTAKELISTPAQHTLPGWTPVFSSGQNWSPLTPRCLVSSSGLDGSSDGPGPAEHKSPHDAGSRKAEKMSEAFVKKLEKGDTLGKIRSKQK